MTSACFVLLANFIKGVLNATQLELEVALPSGNMKHTHGSIEVVCGSMFSGKTDELIRRLVRAKIAKQKVQVFKPAIDVRYAVEKVTSHAGS